tara:strand:- start:2118 stop:2387 length:270 start_codon:yes stop_codon:yes gene_type:complete
MKKLINEIEKIDNVQDLNKVIAVIKNQQKVLKARAIAKAKNQFSVGDTVNINSRGKTLVGEILKINRTKAICLINGDKYDVPLSIMEAA